MANAKDKLYYVKRVTKQSTAYAKIVFYESALDVLESLLIIDNIRPGFLKSYFEDAPKDVSEEINTYWACHSVYAVFKGIMGSIRCARELDFSATVAYLEQYTYMEDLNVSSEKEMNDLLQKIDCRGVKEVVIYNSDSRSVECVSGECVSISEFIRSTFSEVGLSNIYEICKKLKDYSFDSYAERTYVFSMICKSYNIAHVPTVLMAVEAKLVYGALKYEDTESAKGMGSFEHKLITRFLEEDMTDGKCRAFV